MDKNTLLGLLMMGCVIFGFMWLNKPSEEELAARQAEQEQMAEQARIEAERQAALANVPDTLSKIETSGIVPTIMQVGTPDTVDNSVVYADNTVNIKVTGDQLTGTVKAADTKLTKRGFGLSTVLEYSG